MTERIHIHRLEEIAIGETINGETIIANEDNKISTVIKDQILGGKDNSGIIYKKNNYFLSGYSLFKQKGEKISEAEYNKYLDSIKQKTN